MKLSNKRGKRFDYIKRQQRINKKKELRAAKHRRHLKLLRQSRCRTAPVDPIGYYIKLRNRCKRTLYKRVKYKKPMSVVKLDGELGVEKDLKNFIDVAESFLSLKSKELYFDLNECTKMWPTGITLLCSLKQWVELTCYPNKAPRIGSSPSKYEKVNSYLNHSGFYDFVRRDKEIVPNYYKETEIVKIHRETDASCISPREVEIVKLLKKHSGFNEDQIEEFDDVVLTEIFNNVSEHGINNKDHGWWMLCQHHSSAGIISLCIADNGIGIKNNLITGPQREEILKRHSEFEDNDGDFIKIAIRENISGAFKASVKSNGLFMKKYNRGARRGHGLKRVTVVCQKLGISTTILSQKGCISVDEAGSIHSVESRSKRIFAGTLYHLKIPAKNSDRGSN